MSDNPARNVLIFGATGAIGSALSARFMADGWAVTGVTRQSGAGSDSSIRWIDWAYGADEHDLANVAAGRCGAAIDAVVWAQGMNCNDTIQTCDLAMHEDLYRANVLTIIASLQILLNAGALVPAARLCIISSIWQSIARENKLSYCVTKSALSGLVQSLALDLGPEGKLVNAVLPGALDTPMTRANLSPEQIGHLQDMAPLRSMPRLDDVCNLTAFLCSASNSGLTGQFIAADRGFSYAKYI